VARDRRRGGDKVIDDQLAASAVLLSSGTETAPGYFFMNA